MILRQRAIRFSPLPPRFDIFRALRFRYDAIMPCFADIVYDISETCYFAPCAMLDLLPFMRRACH